jgi:hypothetical protein
MQPGDDLSEYAEKWKELCKSVTTAWGSFGPTNIEEEEDLDEEQEKFRACLFLQNLATNRYGSVKEELNNTYLLTKTGYPQTVDAMVRYLDSRLERKQDHKQQHQPNPNKPRPASNIDGEDGGTRATSFSQRSTLEQDDETSDEPLGGTREAQFYQALRQRSAGVSLFNIREDSDTDSETDYITDWTGEKIRK